VYVVKINAATADESMTVSSDGRGAFAVYVSEEKPDIRETEGSVFISILETDRQVVKLHRDAVTSIDVREISDDEIREAVRIYYGRPGRLGR
jgi:hypothetical protein